MFNKKDAVKDSKKVEMSRKESGKKFDKMKGKSSKMKALKNCM